MSSNDPHDPIDDAFREQLARDMAGAELDAPPMPPLSELIREGRWERRQQRVMAAAMVVLAIAVIALTFL